MVRVNNRFMTANDYKDKSYVETVTKREAKTSVADQRSCFKCKKAGHIARYCTAVDSTTKKAGAGVVVKTTEVNTVEVRKPAESPTMEVTDDLQSEVEGGMLKLASGKSVPVMTNCAALRDHTEKTQSRQKVHRDHREKRQSRQKVHRNHTEYSEFIEITEISMYNDNADS
ncbi:hypothetical protein PoB_004178700 [Plakobranchus ocellatus]|uniref:CCHC-type domain-containing protein n=1 Tax=Plakobranchus ocellatus TaxID=259542 RepID=A0AAV4B7Z4_9GAST|nr:hypothetical protein PoB_004178700 [Plakobranchus ocellatus]